MNDPITLENSASLESEDAIDTNFVDRYVGSPSSVDSGMVHSPGSDLSVIDSPSPISPEQTASENISVAGDDPRPRFQFTTPETETLPPTPSAASHSPATQTKGVDLKTVQKILQLLVASKSGSERTVISNLLASIISNSVNKLPVAQSSLLNERDQVHRDRKRSAVESHCEVPAKVPRVDAIYNGQVEPSIVILEQPEQHYRARYESEGCRGPVHGCSEMTFPTIKVNGYSGPVWVTVYLASSDGTPHFHVLCGPGSTKLACRSITLSDGVPAIQVLVGPETEMTAVLDCLSLKRKRKFEADKELKRRGLNPADWKSERKEACFIFTAEIPGVPSLVSCKSRVFQCTAPPGNPEIWWMKPVEGSVKGGEEIGLIGKKFPKAFKVRFFGELPSGAKWEAFGEVDRSKSNQGAGVVKSPCLHHRITAPLTVNVEVCNQGKGSSYVSSDSLEFTYLPSTPEEQSSLGLDEVFPEGLEISELIREMSQHYLPDSQMHRESAEDEKTAEWKQILTAIELLHQSGRITANQLKELQTFVILQDTILLEAFRSSRQSVSDDQFLAVFCQYLAGLHLPV